MTYNSSSSEDSIIKGCIKNKRSAQKELYKRYYNHILNFCMRYTSNEDEGVEILNDVFLKVFKDINKYKGTGSLAGWIRKIALYTAIDYVRKNNSYRKTIDLDAVGDVDIQNEALDLINTSEILQFIQQVSPASRNVFSLYALEGYSHKEIAEMLDISIGTSKWHLANARKELKKMFTKSNNYLIAL